MMAYTDEDIQRAVRAGAISRNEADRLIGFLAAPEPQAVRPAGDNREEPFGLSRMEYLVGESPELDDEKSAEELDPDIIKPIGQLGRFNQPCTKEQRDHNEYGEC